METQSVRGLFEHELRGAYHMEQKLVDGLDKMAANATNDLISEGFAQHREETREHVERLETVFHAMGLEPTDRDCQIVEALDSERRTVEESMEDRDLLNMFYLGAGKKTERIEITTYESLLEMATSLELGDDVTAPLEQNLEEEKATLDSLMSMSEDSNMQSVWERLTP